MLDPAPRQQVQPRKNGCGCGRREANIVAATTEEEKKRLLEKQKKKAKIKFT